MQFGNVSTGQIARSANQPCHRAWNFLFLHGKQYRPTSRTRCEPEELDGGWPEPSMPQLSAICFMVDLTEKA